LVRLNVACGVCRDDKRIPAVQISGIIIYYNFSLSLNNKNESQERGLFTHPYLAIVEGETLYGAIFLDCDIFYYNGIGNVFQFPGKVENTKLFKIVILHEAEINC